MIYQLFTTLEGNTTAVVVRHNDDGSISFIPNDANNIEWQQYQVWLNEGNIPRYR